MRSDDYKLVCIVTEQELARGWKDDPEMFDILCDRAVNDLYEIDEFGWAFVRQTALEALVNFYPEHPRTLELLKNRAENDSDENVRKYAEKILKRKVRENQ